MGSKILLVTTVCIFSIFLIIVFSNVSIADTVEGDIHLMSIVPLACIPTREIEFVNFPIENGTFYQSGSMPDIFRNQLIVSYEILSEEDIEDPNKPYYWLDHSIAQLKGVQLQKIFKTPYISKYFYDDISYSKRWSFFLLGEVELPSYPPPSKLFDIENVPWKNFGQGWYYVNNTHKCVAIWTFPHSDTDTLRKVGNEIVNAINLTFPFYESIHLEKYYYFVNDFEFCEEIIKNINEKDEDELINDVEELNQRIAKCFNRSFQYDTDFGYFFHTSTDYFLDWYAEGIVKPLIDDLTQQSLEAKEYNNKNFENLQQTKSIVQNELSNKRESYLLQITIAMLIVMISVFIFDIIFRIPQFSELAKWFSKPNLDVSLKAYSDNRNQYDMEFSEKEGYDEYILKRRRNPLIGIRISPKGKFSRLMDVIEILAPKKCKANYEEVFSITGDRPFILGKPYTDIHGNIKIFTDIKLVKGKIGDPTIIGFKLNYEFDKGEEEFIKIRISTKDSKVLFEKRFLLKANKI